MLKLIMASLLMFACTLDNDKKSDVSISGTYNGDLGDVFFQPTQEILKANVQIDFTGEEYYMQWTAGTYPLINIKGTWKLVDEKLVLSDFSQIRAYDYELGEWGAWQIVPDDGSSDDPPNAEKIRNLTETGFEWYLPDIDEKWEWRTFVKL